MTDRSNSAARVAVSEMFENCVGCKWTLHILNEVRGGNNRPGALERSARGLTTKVLNERLRKLMRYGILEKTVFEETPPRVEYHLSPFGLRFVAILDEIARLQADRTSSEAPVRSSSGSRAGSAAARPRS